MVQEKGGSLIDTLSAQVIYLTDESHSCPALLAPLTTPSLLLVSDMYRFELRFFETFRGLDV